MFSQLRQAILIIPLAHSGSQLFRGQKANTDKAEINFFYLEVKFKFK